MAIQKTRSQAVTWAKAQNGKLLSWGGYSQCVAFIRAYCNWLGTGQPGGVNGAKDFINVRWPSEYKLEGSPQPGDVVIWNGTPTNKYGHVSIVLEVHNGYILTADQNYTNPKSGGYSGSPITVNNKWTIPNSRLLGFYRPNFKVNATQPSLMPEIGSTIQLIPRDLRNTFKAQTTVRAGSINVTDNTFKYIVRGYDPKYPGRIIINSKSGGGDGVALALYYTDGRLIPGWKKV